MTINYYLKLDGIPGESTAAAHKGEITLTSFSFGLSNSGSPTQPGKPHFANMSVTKAADKASPLLMRAAALGTVIKSATLSSTKSGAAANVSPYTYSFTNVLITSVSDGGASPVAPNESVSFDYETVTYTDTPISGDGTPGTPVSFTYNVVTESGG